MFKYPVLDALTFGIELLLEAHLGGMNRAVTYVHIATQRRKVCVTFESMLLISIGNSKLQQTTLECVMIMNFSQTRDDSIWTLSSRKYRSRMIVIKKKKRQVIPERSLFSAAGRYFHLCATNFLFH